MPRQCELTAVKEAYEKNVRSIDKRIVICAGTGCVANGSLKVHARFVEMLADRGINAVVELKKEEEGVLVSKSGCQGFCQMGPLVTILPHGIMYTKVKPDDVDEIIDASILGDTVIDRLVYKRTDDGTSCPTTEEIPFYSRQSRFVLRQCGQIDPESLPEYIAIGGYQAARRAIAMDGKEVCDEMMRAGLRGRGGGGFLTGRKWEFARVQPPGKKYIICNGDEGDPGAFMDRSLMEGNPHSVIEGMLVAALAIGADEGYVYVRAEYPLAVQRMRKAVTDAREMNILGEGIFGTNKAFDITVMEGAGAFVCGEETALIASIEGKRGMPAPKPPFPAVKGLFGKPTIINNVETLATVPLIFSEGVEHFLAMGTESSSGTKTFALTGHVANTGLIEVPFGTTLRQIINDIAGGVMADDGTLCGTDFKAVQIGGPSGGMLTQEMLDLPLDFDSLKSVDAMVGSGGLVVMNHGTCMVGMARYFMQFIQNESCGKCVVCREGTKQMLALLDDIIEGRATEETIPLLEELAWTVKKGSLCNLGKTAPNPVLSSLKNFRDEYTAHVEKKICPAGRCTALATYRVVAEKCKGCGLCARKCPVGAISGEKAKPYVIDAEKCIKCGACIDNCKFGAIVR
jgi:NADH-quinone oxidoreductase subunit F